MQRVRCDRCGAPPTGAARADEACPCGGQLLLHRRCAWCTGWAAAEPGGPCPHCTAELLPLADFGAARMLVDGGVDRYALPGRVRGLSREQRAELGAAFDQQWSALQGRVDEARWVDRFLLTHRLAGEVEDFLVRLVPHRPELRALLTAGPRGPFDDPDRLREIADDSPVDMTQRMAALALVHVRRATPRDEEITAWLAGYADGALGDEAALTAARWWLRPTRRDRARAREKLAALRDHAELGPWAAVAASRLAGEDERAALEPGLRAALAARSEDLRFAAALELGDEPTLLAARAAPDPEVRARALHALATLRSPAIAADLALGADEVRRSILRGLETPPGPALLDALLAASEASAEMRRDLLGFLRRRRFVQLEPDERERVGGWIERAALPVEAILELVGWATEPVDGGDPRDDGEVRPFVDAAGAALARATSDARREILERQRSELGRWLFGTPPADAAPIVDAWLADPDVAVPLLQQIRLLHAQLHGWGRPADDRALVHLLGVIDRAPTDEALAARVGAALAAERGASGREPIVAALWQRFVDHPARRPALFIAGQAYRHELAELRRASGGPFAPDRDPAGFFATLAAADPLDAPALAREAVEAAEQGGPPPAALVDAVVDHVAPRLAERPCTMLWTLANVASPVANAYRSAATDPADPAAAEAIASVEALRRGWARLAPTMAALAPVDDAEARFAHLVEQIETELRLIEEAEERRAEASRRDEERRLEAARRAAEEAERLRRERELEEHLRRERDRADAERAAWIAAQAGAAVDPPVDSTVASPYDEVLLPDQPLPSMGAYVRFLRAVSAGGDVMAVFRRHEITPERWAACATAWSQLLSSRPELALRFSQLYAALTSPS